MMWPEGGGYGMFFGPLLMILILAVVIGAIVLLVQRLGDPPMRRQFARQTPLEILKERFAKGEIDAQEFDERRRKIGD